jgi:hypothetical protein
MTPALRQGAPVAPAIVCNTQPSNVKLAPNHYSITERELPKLLFSSLLKVVSTKPAAAQSFMASWSAAFQHDTGRSCASIYARLEHQKADNALASVRAAFSLSESRIYGTA